jgi:hypothetical protein
MIYDARTYSVKPGDPLPTPPWVRVWRPSDRKWFDPDTQQWADRPSASRKLAYGQPDPQTYPAGFALTIETPAVVWGVNQDVCVFVHDAQADASSWSDWFYVTVNPTFRIEGNHYVTEAGKKGVWFSYQPEIK